MDDAESYYSMHRQYPIFCTDGACSYATRLCCHPEHLTEGFTSLAGKITHSFASSGSFHQKLNISKMHDSALHSKFLRENHRFTHIHLVQEIMSSGPTYYLQKFSNNVSMTESSHSSIVGLDSSTLDNDNGDGVDPDLHVEKHIPRAGSTPRC